MGDSDRTIRKSLTNARKVAGSRGTDMPYRAVIPESSPAHLFPCSPVRQVPSPIARRMAGAAAAGCQESGPAVAGVSSDWPTVNVRR